MAVVDIFITETGNGGDMELKGRDVKSAFGWQNMVYLAMFGGNPANPTTAERPESEQAFDWWGNKVISTEDETKWFNSLTENTLNTVALNSQGRSLIENAVKTDLSFMNEFANVDVNVQIVGIDKVQITINILKPDNLQSTQLIYLWDGVEGNLTLLSDVLGADFNDDFNSDFTI